MSLYRTSAALLLTTLCHTPATAQELLLDPAQDTPSVVNGVRLIGMHADLLVQGPVMKVRQELVLENAAMTEQGFDLVFPLGRGASITGLTLEVDAVPLEGALLSADEARRHFQTTLRVDGDPALLEHYGEALFRARIHPIPPQQERTLVLSYERMMEREGDLHLLHLPLTAFRRVAGPIAFTVDGELVTEQPVSTLYSPTHAIERDPDSASYEATRTLTHTHFRVESTAELGETDFLAYYQPRSSGSPFEVTVLSERQHNEDGTFLALVQGFPTELEEPDPKNVVFVVDRSGSMKEKKITQAKAALDYLIHQLRPEDRFNIVSYAAETTSFAETLQVPTHDVIERASAYIDAIVADGGTAIEAALRASLAQFTDDSVLGQIVFLTDGLPTNGETDERRLCAIVRENNPHEVRIVAFGLGFDVNGALLDRLATQNHGMSEYVLPDQAIDEKVPSFYERMHAPLLLNANLAITGAEIYDVFPREVGDLYAGHELMLVGRYTESVPIQLTLSGQRGYAREEHTFGFDLARPARTGHADTIGRLWAARKIGYLIDEIRLDPTLELVDPGQQQDDPRIAEIVRLGTRYGVLTEYTSFLAGEGTDLYAFADNVKRCTAEVAERASVVAGAHGVAQACNTKMLQRSGQVAKGNTWVDASGQQVTIEGVSCTNGKTFFRRGDTWLDASLVTAEADETVELFSDEFFALLDRNPWLGGCVARTGDLLVEVEGKNVRIQADE